MKTKFYWNPETLQDLKHATKHEVRNFVKFNTDWEDKKDFNEILNDLFNALK